MKTVTLGERHNIVNEDIHYFDLSDGDRAVCCDELLYRVSSANAVGPCPDCEAR